MGGPGSGPKKEVDMAALLAAYQQELNVRAAAKKIGGISHELVHQRLKPIIDFNKARKERQKRRKKRREKEKKQLMKQLAFLFKRHRAEIKKIKQFRELCRKELDLQVARPMAARVMRKCGWHSSRSLSFEDFTALVRQYGPKETAKKLGIQVQSVYNKFSKHEMGISKLRG